MEILVGAGNGLILGTEYNDDGMRTWGTADWGPFDFNGQTGPFQAFGVFGHQHRPGSTAVAVEDQHQHVDSFQLDTISAGAFMAELNLFGFGPNDPATHGHDWASSTTDTNSGHLHAMQDPATFAIISIYDGGTVPQSIFLTAIIATTGGGGPDLPVGGIYGTLLDTAPAGYLPCDGSLLTVADYPALFAALGYLHGGTGAYFALPDLRGRSIPAAGGRYAAGEVGGSNVWDPGWHTHDRLGVGAVSSTPNSMPNPDLYSYTDQWGNVSYYTRLPQYTFTNEHNHLDNRTGTTNATTSGTANTYVAGTPPGWGAYWDGTDHSHPIIFNEASYELPNGEPLGFGTTWGMAGGEYWGHIHGITGQLAMSDDAIPALPPCLAVNFVIRAT
jgi:hypothetical protein